MLSEDIIPVLQRAYHAHRGPYQPSRGPIMLSEDSTSPPKDPNSFLEGSVMLSEDLTSLSEGISCSQWTLPALQRALSWS